MSALLSMYIFVILFQRVDKMSLVILEKTSSLNEITVAHRTIQGQLEGKTAELESLLQQNREVRFANIFAYFSSTL